VVRARERAFGSLPPLVHASMGALVAWWVAHGLLGHPQPFFAPIAATVALSSSRSQRSRRSVQLVAGVLLGIGVADVLATAVGNGTLALGAIVLVTMLVAVAVGAGFVGEGMMFVNQAAASAILVVTFHQAGTGAERAIDALIGGAVALVIVVLLFPAAPLPRLRRAERDVLDALGDALARVDRLVRGEEELSPDWMLAVGHGIHDRLATLAGARATARRNVRVAPRRFHLRGAVDAEDERIARVDLLANAVLSLIRGCLAAREADEALPDELLDAIRTLAGAMAELSRTAQPWPAATIERATRAARSATSIVEPDAIDRGAVVASITRATGRDLLAILRQPE
jgi:uncharacterized membrane protein YgaE (UPF0421/DUF939 family)